MKAAKTLTVYLTLMLANQTLVLAQNPLRAAPPEDQRAISQAQFDTPQNRGYAPPVRDEAGIGNARRLSDSWSDQRTSHTGFQTPADTRIDAHVVPVSYDQVERELGGREYSSPNAASGLGFTANPGNADVPGDSNPGADEARGQQKNSSAGGFLAAMGGGPMDHNQLLNLLMKISINLAFVLSFAVGVILIARRWIKPGQSSVTKERAAGDSLSIRETLRLDNKISIRLVQWRANRFLVACDQNGIQSVHSLNASFDQTIRELDDQSMDENLIRKFIAGMETGRAAA